MPPQTTDDQATIYSSLPVDDAKFRHVVEQFMYKLPTKLDAMCTACERRDFQELATLAHWLKGAGGTVGFHDFTQPSLALENVAKAQQDGETVPALAKLFDIAARLSAEPPPANSD